MTEPPPEKWAEWRERASRKGAIVPQYFVVRPDRVDLVCGSCGLEFKRPLVPNIDEPTFICPNESCHAKNWVPVRFEIKRNPHRPF